MSPFPTTENPPAERNEQTPLGPHPTYDDVLDVAVAYTFPCSDPIAVDACCSGAGARGISPPHDAVAEIPLAD
jgi:hypothetical protein